MNPVEKRLNRLPNGRNNGIDERLTVFELGFPLFEFCGSDKANASCAQFGFPFFVYERFVAEKVNVLDKIKVFLGRSEVGFSRRRNPHRVRNRQGFILFLSNGMGFHAVIVHFFACAIPFVTEFARCFKMRGRENLNGVV